MEHVEWYFENLLAGFEKGMYWFVNLGDPIVVSITLFILLAPVALMYVVIARIAMFKLTQMTIKGKNILYVIAHPDDEAM